jgi:cyclic pyranopterin phosphate synthase
MMLKELLSGFRNRLQNRLFGMHEPSVRTLDGMILPQYACQTDLVDHCNLSCRDCDHASPSFKKRHAEPETLHRDFSILAKVYKPQLVQLLGGEPLLHPDIIGAIHAIRSSGISERIMVFTNGLLLDRMKDDFWASVDDLEISVYPGSGLDQIQINRYKDKAIEYNVRLKVYAYQQFRRQFSLPGSHDPALTQRIYDACMKVHVWGCHSVYAGHIYRCPQSIFIPRMLGLPPEQLRRDGLEIRDTPEFFDQLLAYLTSPVPLQACRNCLATVGVKRNHVQVVRQDWLKHQGDALEDSVDYAELHRIEAKRRMRKSDHLKQLIDHG